MQKDQRRCGKLGRGETRYLLAAAGCLQAAGICLLSAFPLPRMKFLLGKSLAAEEHKITA